MNKKVMICFHCALLWIGIAGIAFSQDGPGAPSTLMIGPYAKADAAKHQEWIQKRLDEAPDAARTFRFAPGEYVITHPRGLFVPDGSTLIMDGVRFLFAKDMKEDGQGFLIENGSNISFQGGMLIGSRDAWDAGTNIAGIRIKGKAENIRFMNMRFENLSSNAIGVFGESDENPIRNITLIDVVGVNCCNFYGDYLQSNIGPAPGSDRKDQGTIAMYYVDGWLVDGCRFEQSQSDGTHFFHSHNGRFVNSVVTDSKMGGYFLEGCEQVLASENLICRNGSRGVTIERDSRFCTLTNNVIAFSGREGLWAPDVLGVIVNANIFRENGQKDDGEKDCEIRIDTTSEFKTDTKDIWVVNNIFYTKDHQTATIYVSDGVKDILIEKNMFRGPAVERYTPLTRPQ